MNSLWYNTKMNTIFMNSKNSKTSDSLIITKSYRKNKLKEK